MQTDTSQEFPINYEPAPSNSYQKVTKKCMPETNKLGSGLSWLARHTIPIVKRLISLFEHLVLLAAVDLLVLTSSWHLCEYVRAYTM